MKFPWGQNVFISVDVVFSSYSTVLWFERWFLSRKTSAREYLLLPPRFGQPSRRGVYFWYEIWPPSRSFLFITSHTSTICLNCHRYQPEPIPAGVWPCLRDYPICWSRCYTITYIYIWMNLHLSWNGTDRQQKISTTQTCIFLFRRVNYMFNYNVSPVYGTCYTSSVCRFAHDQLNYSNTKNTGRGQRTRWWSSHVVLDFLPIFNFLFTNQTERSAALRIKRQGNKENCLINEMPTDLRQYHREGLNVTTMKIAFRTTESQRASMA